MSTIRRGRIWAMGLLTVWAALARAEDVSTKKLFVKDHADPAKRQIQVLSKGPGVEFSEAGDPGTNGASVHVYSATDDFCVILPPGAGWLGKPTKWKYKNKTTKNAAEIKDGKLLVRIRSGVAYTLADNGTQGTINAQVQFGTGTRYCLRCPGNKKDEALKFLGKNCAATPCDAEPSSCDPLAPPSTTTSTTVVTTTTPSTTLPGGGAILQGALPASTGRFNYTPMQPGVPGANTRCNLEFSGSHACTYAELQAAEAAGDLDGIKDIDNVTVTSFWAIDSSQPATLQCTVSVAWDYATAHTGQFGQMVTLNNGTGALGPLMSGAGQGVLCAQASWVGCCS